MKALCIDTKTGERQEFTIAVDPRYKEIIQKELKRVKIWMACKLVLKDYAERGIIVRSDGFPYHDYTQYYTHKIFDGSTHKEIIQRSHDIFAELKSC